MDRTPDRFNWRSATGTLFTVIGTDGGLLPEPLAVKSLPLAMAERADVVVDFSRIPVGTKVFLLNTREKSALQGLMRFDVAQREQDDASVPPRLSDPGFL